MNKYVLLVALPMLLHCYSAHAGCKEDATPVYAVMNKIDDYDDLNKRPDFLRSVKVALPKATAFIARWKNTPVDCKEDYDHITSIWGGGGDKVLRSFLIPCAIDRATLDRDVAESFRKPQTQLSLQTNIRAINAFQSRFAASASSECREASAGYSSTKQTFEELLTTKPTVEIEITRQGKSSTYSVVCPGRTRSGTVDLSSSGNICATGPSPTCKPRDSWSLQAAAEYVCS